MIDTGALTGRALGPYQIETLIGIGGMSEVYRATDGRLGRTVALKVLSPQLARNVGFRDRFLRESRLASTLDHPRVVAVYEAGEADGFLYIAMRYVDGIDLRSLIERESPLSPKRASWAISQAADALDAAHERGLIHRDVKPANILVVPTPDRRRPDHIFLTDFGLTKFIGSDSRYTETGQLVGTVHYMSPEQIEGREVDGRSDVYSLGCVLYECLTGQVPYPRDSDLSVLWAHVNGAIPLVTQIRSDVTDAFNEVVTIALAKSPAERFQTCGELAAATRAAFRRVPKRRAAVLSHAPQRTRTAEPQQRSRVAAITTGLRTAAAALLVVTAMVSGAYGLARAVGIIPSSHTAAGTGMTPPTGSKAKSVQGQPSASQKSGGRSSRVDDRSSSESDGHGFPGAQAAHLTPGIHGGSTDKMTNLIAKGGVGSETDIPRTLTGTYNVGPASVDGSGFTDCESYVGDNPWCVWFLARNNERFVEITIDDRSSTSVLAWVRQDVDHDGKMDGEWHKICSTTAKPIQIAPGARVNIWVLNGNCANGSSSAPTTGRVTAVFHTSV